MAQVFRKEVGNPDVSSDFSIPHLWLVTNVVPRSDSSITKIITLTAKQQCGYLHDAQLELVDMLCSLPLGREGTPPHDLSSLA